MSGLGLPVAASGLDACGFIRRSLIIWMRRNGFYESRNPILKPLDTIECRDAILTPDNTEPDWPEADVIIGNPPFLGGNRLIANLGEDYVSRIFETYAGRVPSYSSTNPYNGRTSARLTARGGGLPTVS